MKKYRNLFFIALMVSIPLGLLLSFTGTNISVLLVIQYALVGITCLAYGVTIDWEGRINKPVKRNDHSVKEGKKHEKNH